MARPERNTVDYFPFYCDEGKKMFYIEETYGNDGFAVFIKLLRELAKTDFHYLNLAEKTTQMFLAAKCKVSQETLLMIIKDLAELGKFDKSLWDENKVIWCQDFIDSIQDAYSRRNNKCITYDDLCSLLISLGVRKQNKCISNGDINTQSIVKYTKVNKTKGKETSKKPTNRFTPPTLLEVENFFLENGYTKQAGKKAFMYYQDGNWKDSKGNQVKNWKQKMRGVWFKDENKIDSQIRPKGADNNGMVW